MKLKRMQTSFNGLSRTAGLIALAAVGLAMSASAQVRPGATSTSLTADGLATEIEQSGSCAAANPLTEMRRHLLLASSLSATEIGRALALVSVSPTVCDPIRAAALTLSEAYPQPNEPQQLAAAETLLPSGAADAALAPVASDADLKFTVAPPPRRLTKGRNPGS